MTQTLHIARNARSLCELLPAMANRHGLISGATGTGKTVTLQKIAEQFSCIGVPVFAADIKGDLSGISQTGSISGKLATTLAERHIDLPAPVACPTTLWDVFGEQGHPVRTTISEMGPLLLSHMLELNDTQSGVLSLAFKIADDNHLLLLDMKDLRAMLQYLGENAKQFTTSYGNISAASIGAIQRNLLQLEEQGGDHFFGEPALNIDDLMQTANGQGMINLLAADKLLNAPRVYSAFLLWLLSALFERLPEVGDPEKPKLIFFFDEAHMLFKGASKVLLERIELVVRLVRSKGVGVFFATQNPLDIPSTVLAQLGNRVQHALRAFSAKDQKAVKAIAQTMPLNPDLDLEASITELATGEALVSFLDARGKPTSTQRAFVIPPGSQIGPINAKQREVLLKGSLVAGVYENEVDRESAYEILQQRADHGVVKNQSVVNKTQPATDTLRENKGNVLKDLIWGSIGPRGARKDGVLQTVVKSTARTLGNQAGRKILRGILGCFSGNKK